MPYRVFISYRRATGDTMARFLYDRLKDDGYQPFLDIEQMRSGRFNTQLYSRIAECDDFLLILSPGALDRCRNEDDWLRMEILEALRLRKNIVPYILRDFEFPGEPTRLQKMLGGKTLPREILDLRYYQGVAASQEYFDSSYERLKSLLYYQPGSPAPADSAQEPSSSVAPGNISALLDRAFMLIEDGEFIRANLCLEQVLNLDVQNVQAYLGKLLIEFRQHRPEHLAELKTPIDQSPNYQRIMQFGDPALQEQLRAYNRAIQARTDLSSPPSPPRRKRCMKRILLSILLVLLAAAVGLGVYFLSRQLQLRHAVQLFKDGQQKQALTAADPQKIYYTLAQEYLEQDQQGYACLYFMKAGDYRDSQERMRKLQQVLSGKITAGNFFTAAVKKDGSVLFTGTTENAVDAAASWKNVRSLASFYSWMVGITEDGSLLYTGTPFPVQGGPYVTAAASYDAFLAVSETGEVFIHPHQLLTHGKITQSWTDVVAADGYFSSYIALKRDGTVYATSDGDEYPLSGWKDIVAVGIGGEHYVGLKKDGTLVTAGSNEQHQCDVGDWQDIVAISCYYNTTCGLKSDGTVVTTDDYLAAQLSQWQDVVAICNGFNHIVGLKADGTVVAVGYNSDHEAGQREVSGWNLFE